MKWKTYWLYAGSEVIQSVLLPVGATDLQVRQKAYNELDIIPGYAYPRAPFEHRNMINHATVVPDNHEFERATPKEYWGFIPPGLLEDPPNQPESPWVTRQRECDAARERAMVNRRRRIMEAIFPIEDLGPAI